MSSDFSQNTITRLSDRDAFFKNLKKFKEYYLVQYMPQFGYDDDKEMMLYAISLFPLSIIYASDKLKSDGDCVREIFKHAVKGDFNESITEAFESLPNEIKDNKVLVKELIAIYPYIYHKLNILKDDEDIVLTAIGNIADVPVIMSSLPSHLKGNKDFIKKALLVNRNSLGFATEALTKDIELIKLAIDRHVGLGINYMHVDMKNDKEIFKYAFHLNAISVGLFYKIDNPMFQNFLNSEDYPESFFIESLKNIDKLNLEDLEFKPEEVNYAYIIDQIMIKISKESLEKIEFTGEMVKPRKEISLKNKEILEIPFSLQKPIHQKKRILLWHMITLMSHLNVRM